MSAYMIHINLNMIFYTHVKHSPTKTIYIKYYLKLNVDSKTRESAKAVCPAFVFFDFGHADVRRRA